MFFMGLQYFCVTTFWSKIDNLNSVIKIKVYRYISSTQYDSLGLVGFSSALKINH